MLRLMPPQPAVTVWDALLPAEVRALPEELARLDQVLADPALLCAFDRSWAHARRQGRPTIPMATYLRLMVVKHRTGWGYETLVREVSDSLHLRRFCWIALDQSVPDESTVRKLTRRLGSAVVDELIRGLITKAVRERRFRPRAMRTDSTVAEADIRFPTDCGLCGDAVKLLARAGRKLRRAVPTATTWVQDRSRAVGKRLRALSRTLRRRSGEAKDAVRRMTEAAAKHVQRSVGEARRLLAEAKRRRSAPQRRGARRRAIAELQRLVALSARAVEQVRIRFAGERITDRLVSLADPEARPVRRGKLARPNEFGYVVQLAEVTAHTRHGARGLILPPKLGAGSTHENALLPETVSELVALNLSLQEAAFDAGFVREATEQTLQPVGARAFIVGTANTGSRRTRRRLACFRVGSEGRISHLKRSYAVGRSRLRGTEGARIWEGWAVLAYDLDTLAALTA
jgi:IS5 family transposase